MKKNINVMVILIFATMICGVLLMMFIFLENNEGIIENEITDYDITDEEYITVLLDNKNDFEYIVQIMQQWEKGYISFSTFEPSVIEEIELDNRFYTNNQEMADEIMNNEEFYNHLANLFELEEITYIVVDGDWGGIIFYFSKNPINYHAVLNYTYEENRKIGGPTSVIDEHWILQVLPNT